jgi:adenylate kinase family enzyme
LHVPIKIGFLGDSLSGKTTIAQKICHKYGLILINPVQLINEAFDLNK